MYDFEFNTELSSGCFMRKEVLLKYFTNEEIDDIGDSVNCSHLPMMVDVVDQFYLKTKCDVDYSELFRAAFYAMMDAVFGFDFCRDGDFFEYCKKRIKTSLYEALDVIALISTRVTV